MSTWIDPKRVKRPPVLHPEQSAGWLGYYARRYLQTPKPKFDLMDLDSSWPTVWCYRKGETRELRFFEEKPAGDTQVLRDSESRILRDLATMPRVSCFVIWEADRLGADPPQFPLEITRIYPNAADDDRRVRSREWFDNWMQEGVATRPPRIDQLLEMSFEPPPEWPGTREQYIEFDRLVTEMAVAMARR